MSRFAGALLLFALCFRCLAVSGNSLPDTPGSTIAEKQSPWWEVSLEPSFGLDTERATIVTGTPGAPVFTDTTVHRLFAMVPLELRYNHNATTALAVEVPYLWRKETTNDAALSLDTTAAGLGDIRITVDHVMPRWQKSSWDGTLNLQVQTPTGRSRFDNLAGNELPLGTGHYVISGIVGVQKIADPLLVSFGVGAEYTIPRRLAGTLISPTLGYLLRSELGLALDDRWLVSEQLSFARRTDVFLTSPGATGTLLFEEAYVTHSLLYHPYNNRSTMRLSFSVGLNDTSLDYITALMWHREL